jgi:PIN domain nuclease of toxin-antitoxin system
MIRFLGCSIVAFSEGQALEAGSLVAQTREFGLSLGDRACLALAIDRKATVYTTDRAWAELGLGIRVEVIR